VFLIRFFPGEMSDPNVPAGPALRSNPHPSERRQSRREVAAMDDLYC
jgi:hypothetical protein